jgi:hypothetical protein
MGNIFDFIKNNYLNILIIVIFVLGLLVIINLKGINLNPPKPQAKLIQEVTVEGYENEELEQLKLKPSDSFCESYLGNSAELELECNKLTESNCNETKCCVFTVNKESRKCLAGSINGPTYKTDKDGKLITLDSYYYMGNLMPK